MLVKWMWHDLLIADPADQSYGQLPIFVLHERAPPHTNMDVLHERAAPHTNMDVLQERAPPHTNMAV